MKIYENLRKSTKIYNNRRKSTNIQEHLRKSERIYEDLRESMKIYENLRKSIQWSLKAKEGRRPAAAAPPLVSLSIEQIFVDFRICSQIFIDVRRFSQIFIDLRRFSLIFIEALKMAEIHEKQCFTCFAFLPPYIGVSGSLVSRKRQISMRSIDWYQKFLISRLAARYSTVFVLRRSKQLKITKNYVLRFLPFYPLISTFQALSCLANASA